MAQPRAMAGEHVRGAALAEELRFCVGESKSKVIWGKVSSFVTTDVNFLVTAFYMVTVPWIWLQSLKLFLHTLRNLYIEKGQEQLEKAINRDQALKDRIEQLEAEKEDESQVGEKGKEIEDEHMDNEKEDHKVEEELDLTHPADLSAVATLCGNASPSKISPEIPTTLPEPSGSRQGGSNPTAGSQGASSTCPEAPLFITVFQGNRAKLEHKTRKQFDVNRFDLPGCSILQSQVELSHEAMANLQDLAQAATLVDNSFVVQISRWRLFIHAADGVKKLRLDDSHQVPIILHAAYAAGKLIIQGLNLTGAEIKAATFSKCITLTDFTKEEVVGGLQMWTSIVRLPSNNLNEVFVYATKAISVEGHDGITVCSSIINIQDDNLRTVLRVGIPSTIGLVYVMVGFICLKGWHFMPPAFVWILPLIAMALTQILPQSTENAIKSAAERIGLATITLCYATWSLFVTRDLQPAVVHKRDDSSSSRRDLSDCTQQDGTVDPKEQREPEEAVDDGETISTDDDEILARPSPHHSIMPSMKCDGVKGPGGYGGERKYREVRREMPAQDMAMRKEPKYERKKERPPKGGGAAKKKLPRSEEEPQCYAYEEYRDVVGRTLVRKRDHKSTDAEAELKKRKPFKFVHGLKDKMWYRRDYFKILSPHLIRVFLEVPEKVQLLGSQKITVYVSDFFHKREELKKTLGSGEEGTLVKDGPSTKSDTEKLSLQNKYIWQFLEASFQEVVGRYEAMRSEGCVSWDMLWAFFPTGTEVEYRCKVTGERLCGKVQHIRYAFPEFMVGIQVWDYNCTTWESYTVQRSIAQYDGACSFTSLKIHPLQFKSDPDEEERKFLAKGAWFGKLSMKTRNRFMHYKGLMYMQREKEAVNGRVMIDLASFAKMKPDYHMENAYPSPAILRTNHVETIDISRDSNRKYAPAIVFGFSFQTKMWGAFAISGFEEIVFNQLAFDTLVMDKAKKAVVHGLVQKYERNQDVGQRESEDVEQVDPIAGKGEGCIFLCYGPPGTGKTFTAESISEKLKAPLWSLSVSELGTTPKKLEEKLVKVLDVAASWGAILLLDEADIYMEKRTSVDLERNAMTGIFLRNLEYYRGVLFLTTNRVVAFDDAFCSRISMFLYYAKHSVVDRQTIWKNLLEPFKMRDLTDHLLAKFASYDLNAREIRNVVQVARTLAERNGEKLNGTYLVQSSETLADSIEELKRVTGGENTTQTSIIESREELPQKA